MQLNFQVFPDDRSLEKGQSVPLVIVPGLFGSISNWRSVAKTLSAKRAVIVIDQRNHGRSPHDDSHSYADMVADLVGLCDHLGLEQIDLAGHSMGGKVAMLLGLRHPALLRRLIVLDIAPITYSHSHAPFLEALLRIDLSQLESRKDADRALTTAIADTPTRLFLLQSLAGSPGDYHWRLNLRVLHEFMPEIVGFPETSLSSKIPALAIAGQMSTYLLPEHHAKLLRLFPEIQFASVAEAGHWLHAEQPQRVIKLIEDFLQ